MSQWKWEIKNEITYTVLPLALLVLGVGTTDITDHHDAFTVAAADDMAIFADNFAGSTDFHDDGGVTGGV
ncbi:MAG: hypothetical protein JWM56_896 [Candidatus Peribacteria bacterium]|nr:hypothetical protein [Candidatus Peribacteria bacterium]